MNASAYHAAGTLPAVLAQSADGGVVRIWVWGAVLIVVAVAALFVILAIKRRLVEGGDTPSSAWTLQDLRALHAAGELSDAEYETLREQVIGSLGAKSGDDDVTS